MKRFLPLLLLPLLLLSGCKVAHDTEFLPTQAQEEQSVWISQEPLAFLTRARASGAGFCCWTAPCAPSSPAGTRPSLGWPWATWRP